MNLLLEKATKKELFEEIERLRHTLAYIACEYVDAKYSTEEGLLEKINQYKEMSNECHLKSIDWEVEIILDMTR